MIYLIQFHGLQFQVKKKCITYTSPAIRAVGRLFNISNGTYDGWLSFSSLLLFISLSRWQPRSHHEP